MSRSPYILFLLVSIALATSPTPNAQAQSDPEHEEESTTPYVAPPAPEPSPAFTNGRSTDARPDADAPTAASSDAQRSRPATPWTHGRPADARPSSSADRLFAPAGALPTDNGRTASQQSNLFADSRPAVPKAVGDGSVRLSQMGPDGNPAYDAYHPAVAYDPTRDQYLVAWTGTDDAAGLANGETEIYGVLVSGTTGDPVGSVARISTQGPDGDAAFAAQHPAVLYNGDRDEFFVVWQGSATAGEEEVYGRHASASDLTLSGTTRLSRIGSDGDPADDALTPDVAYNPSTREYLIVFHGATSIESEVYVRRVSDGDLGFGTSRQAISSAGPSGDPDWRIEHPVAAYVPSTDAYVLAWAGADDASGGVEGEFEIYVQRLDASAAQIGTDDQRISQAGTDGDPAVDAVRPALRIDDVEGQAFVTWSSNAADGAGAFEAYGQRLDVSTGAEVGTDDLRLSTMGASGATAFSGFAPAVAGVPGREHYVLWRGDDATDDAFEVYGQRVFVNPARGDEGGTDDERLSGLSPSSSATGAVTSAIAANGTGTYLLVWSGDTTAGAFVEGEHEIFARLVQPGTPLPVELVSFQARPVSDGVALEWSTASETNNAGFVLQRRADTPGATWTSVADVPGSGTTSSPKAYQFVDTSLPYDGDRFVYRLGQVDTDGTPTMLEERQVRRGAVSRLELLGTFPNPARTYATVRFAVPDALTRRGDVRLRLYDVLGRAVRTTSTGSDAERRELRLDLSGLAPGTYFLHLSAGDQMRTQKLTIVR